MDALDPVRLAQAIVFAQIALLVLTLPFSLSDRARRALRLTAGLSGLGAVAGVGLFIATLLGLGGLPSVLANSVVVWSLIGLGVAVLQVAILGLRGLRMRVDAARLQTPAVRSRAGDELRAILRSEGVELDERLEAARTEREQFLYALEERHAAQIASIAEEYQAEARTILTQLLDQLAAEQLQPLVEQRLAEHGDQLRSELGALEKVAAGETLNQLRDDLATLDAKIEEASGRVAEIRRDNPESTIEERVNARVDEIVAGLDGRRSDLEQGFEQRLGQAQAAMEARISELADMVNGKVDLAGNPLLVRMEEAQRDVDLRMKSYLASLERRFEETEKLLTERTIQQESALQERVIALEASIDERLTSHGASIEQVLSTHDGELHGAIEEQVRAVHAHVEEQRTRLVADVDEHGRQLSERMQAELAAAEENARAAVTATHEAWESFTADLEERFAATRQQAIDEAQDIARAEREQLLGAMQQITGESQAHIQEQLEMVGREAAWQRAQVERSVSENLDLLQRSASEAMASADEIFADLERMGADRVESIRVRAEESLVSSRQYIEQLEGSLNEHLEAMQQSASQLAEDLDARLTGITGTAQQAGDQLEAYARQLIDSVTDEVTRLSEQRVNELDLTLTQDLQAKMQAAVDQQHRRYEEHLAELSQQVLQQVNGDLAGLVENARGVVSTELEAVIQDAQRQAQEIQRRGHGEVMQELARQQQELATSANEAAAAMRSMIDGATRDSRRQLDESLAAMGAHLREELVRFQDEGRRRTEEAIERLRHAEQDLLRDEDRRLASARGELVRRHQETIQRELSSALGTIDLGLGSPSATPAGSGGLGFAGVQRPATPLTGGQGGQQQPQQPPTPGTFGS